MPSPKRRSATGPLMYWAAGSLLCLAAAALIVVHIGGAVIPHCKLTQIVNGTPPGEVLSILGDPVQKDGSSWIYEKWGNPGWVEVHFDNGKVDYVNDESPIPELSLW